MTDKNHNNKTFFKESLLSFSLSLLSSRNNDEFYSFSLASFFFLSFFLSPSLSFFLSFFLFLFLNQSNNISPEKFVVLSQSSEAACSSNCDKRFSPIFLSFFLYKEERRAKQQDRKRSFLSHRILSR